MTLPKLPSNRRTVIPTHDLDPSAFAAFGQVIQNPSTHTGQPNNVQRVVANQGTADKWLDVTHMHDWYASQSPSRSPAKCVMNMFVCKPRTLEKRRDGDEVKRVFLVKILERHPYTPQTFVPMGLAREHETTRYLVIVAPTLGKQNEIEVQEASSQSLSAAQQPKGTGLPDLDNVQAFLARGDQAVTYGPGTWHAPMVVLGARPIDFLVVQYANGVGEEDCQEVDVPSGENEGVEVEVKAFANDGDGVIRSSQTNTRAKL